VQKNERRVVMTQRVPKKGKEKQKVFVLDTNVLVHDPWAFFKFPRHHVIIPLTVIEELDNLKKSPGEVGKSARTAIRGMCETKLLGQGTLYEGITLDNGAVLRISTEYRKGSEILNADSNDNKIILTALDLTDKGFRVVFVSKDFAVRLKAEALGLEAEDYECLKASYESLTGGCRTITLEKEAIDTFFKEGKLPCEPTLAQPNEYVFLTDGQQSSIMARFDGAASAFIKLAQAPTLWGIKPRNAEQKCAIDALLREEVKLVTLIGPAGTGKTLLALAAGMRKVFDEGTYRKILISRPIVPLGRDIGYLPGTKEEKLSSWMQPIFDNLELLCASKGNEVSDTLTWVLENKKIEMEAVTYIRGRSLPKMYIIIDEAQNLTPHEVKTIISRAGEGTKVILAGDPTQIDNPYLDKDSNGLTYAFAKFLDKRISASVFLEKTERSELAALAAELL
jgi:PhoH-like ATPase